jgi:hypothetical protein
MAPRSQKRQTTKEVNVSELVESLNTDKKALRRHHAVMTCSKCRAIVGDTTSIKAVYQLTGVGGHIALGSVTNCTVTVDNFEMTDYARVLGKDNGSALVRCSSSACDNCLGIILAGVDDGVLTTSFSLGLDNVERYYLGSAEMTLGDDGNDDDVQQEHEEEQKQYIESGLDTRIKTAEADLETLRNHIETIQRVLESHDQELVLQNKRLREHSEVLQNLL